MSDCSRLCDLVTASLLPYIEPKPISLNKETEKDLLLSLSRVSREIRQWAKEFNCQETVVKPLADHDCLQDLESPLSGEDKCFAHIISVMVSLLTFDSQFIGHLAGNVILSASIFLAQYESKWVKFVSLLWMSLEALVSSISSCTQSSSLAGFTDLTDKRLVHHHPHTNGHVSERGASVFYFTNIIEFLRSRSVNINSVMVSGLFRTLRNILKSLKHDDSGELQEAFLHLAVASLLKMPWDLLSEIDAGQIFTNGLSSERDGLRDGRIGSLGSKDVLLGTVLQLFCSLVEQKDSADVGGSSLVGLDTYSKLINLLPKLLCSCFPKQLGHNNCLSHYLRHKALMLMVRLSFHENWESSCPMSWLKLLGQYFGDLLYENISEYDDGSVSCLEGSPFLVSGEKDYYPYTRHLQRQSVLLLFRCCIFLVRINKDSSVGCEFQLTSKCCYHHMGLSELSEWLQRCGFLERFLDYENYSKSCSRFASSFLQLFIEDDDMFFEMLLQLLDAPFCNMQIESNVKDRSLEELKRDIPLHLSSIFNSIHLFHLFLLLLHYDHLVLVDYLISKDTGVQCVQYLLRCLRKICESWLVFVEFSICGNEMNHSCLKRRKISVDEDNGSRKLKPLSSSTVVVKEQYAQRNMNQNTYKNAKECLLSLKRSVEDLHRKNLFPYNPRPLLRSFSRFQELCG